MKTVIIAILAVVLFQSTALAEVDEQITYNNAGVVFLNQKKYPQAIEQFDRALEVLPDYKLAVDNRMIAYRMWGESELEQKKWSEAADIFQKGLSYTHNASLFNLDARAQLHLKNFKQMLEDESQAADRAESSLRGFAYLGLNRFADAVTEFSNKESSDELLNQLGLALVHKKQHNDAFTQSQFNKLSTMPQYRNRLPELKEIAAIYDITLPALNSKVK